MNKGKIIVIDGLDGCGKSTQLEICAKRLEEEGKKIRKISFPDYDSPSSAPVKMYLSGEIAKKADQVNAYAASSFYAVDRYISYKKYWEEDYLEGSIILAGRYVSSNAMHQMSKLSEEDWDSYLDWLADYEYNKLELPRADCTIFLDMPYETAQKLLSGRYGGDENKKDVHEGNEDYMRKCRRAALYAAERLSWHTISCADSEGEPRAVADITKEILRIIRNS
jgi:dTMP kinase